MRNLLVATVLAAAFSLLMAGTSSAQWYGAYNYDGYIGWYGYNAGAPVAYVPPSTTVVPVSVPVPVAVPVAVPQTYGYQSAYEPWIVRTMFCFRTGYC